MDRLLLWIAQGGGLGRVPKVPGTIGTLGGFPLTALFLLPGNFWVYLSGCVLFTFISAWVCSEAERIMGEKDPHPVVLDEIIAVPICFLGVFGVMEFRSADMPTLIAVFQMKQWWLWALLGFGLFRLFDIWKPGPVNTLQNLHGGWGVTMDDVLAGVVVSVILGVAFLLIQ